MSLKVLLMGPDLQAFSGGIQTHMRIFLQAYEADPNIELIHFAVTEGKHDQEGWLAKTRRLLSKLRRFRQVVKTVDVVHVNGTFDTKSLIRDCLLLASCVGLKPVTVFQFHGGSPESQAKSAKRWLINVLLRCFASRGPRLFLSTRQRDEFAKGFAMDSRVVPNFYDFSQPLPAKAPLDPAVGCHFIYLGRLHASKGVDLCLDVAEQLLGEGQVFRLSVYGGGPELEAIQARIKTIDQPAIQFGGVLSGAEKDQALLQADVMLLPTRHKEGFPYAVLEALHHRLALIVTGEGALREVVETDQNGVLLEQADPVELADAMRRYLQQPELARQHGQAGFERGLAQYDVSLLRHCFDAIYQQAAANRQR